MLTEQDVRTSRRISHALRHQPEKYGLHLDEHGFAPLDQVLEACRCSEDAFARIVADSEKPRFEVVDGRVRATHGHTIDVAAVGEPAAPPAVLYHGTTQGALDPIMAQGLKPMRRQYVHLHEDRTVADDAARRFSGRGQAVMLVVDAAMAHEAGVEFFPTQGGVWLARSIDAQYLRVEGAEEGTV